MQQYFLVRLKEVLKEKNLTQKKLAELSDVSIYKIRQWEKCISYPDVFDAATLCCILDVQLEYLRGISNIKEIPRYADLDKKFGYIMLE